MPDERRMAFIEITPQLILSWLCGVDRPYRSNLPADARFVALDYDPVRHTVRVLFESAGVSSVREGDVVPRFYVVMTTHG